MKTFSLLCMLIISFPVFGQIENFIVENPQVRWQKVYSTLKGPEEITEELKKRNNLIIIEKKNNIIEGQILNLVMDYKKAGYSRLGTPEVLGPDVRFSGFFTIEFKEGKYRATARNIISQGGDYTVLVSNMIIDGNQNSSLENMVLNKHGEIRNNFKNAKAKIIDTTFTSLFDFTSSIIEKSDNW